MQRRDLPKALLAAATASAVTVPQAQTCAPPCFALTDPERAAGVTPVNFTFAAGDVRRYGAAGDGKTADDDAIQAALNVAARGGSPVVLPAGRTFRITRYLSIGSNTVVLLYGTLQLTNRASGLYADGASNIGVFGFKTGRITDPAVAAGYAWNGASGTLAPAIHLRSVSDAIVDGICFTYVSQGCMISSAAQNSVTRAFFTLKQAAPVNITVRDCSMTHCEWSGLSCYSGQYCTFESNYVYRCGDGGLWMMGALDSKIINNHRISPYATPSEVAAHGANNPAHPATWNDEQGIELEACRDVLVCGNVVMGFQAFGIDIKNTCNRVIVRGNQVSDCENAAIVVRRGETANPCHKVSLIANTISGHGRVHYGGAFPMQGAILASDCYLTEIIDNVIYAYQNTVGINCVGPASYLGSQYRANPHQASLVVRGNSFDFKNSFQTNEAEIQYTGSTLSAIVVRGYYDAVQLVDNKIGADCYYSSDSRRNTTPAVALYYENANGTHYPSNAKVDGNTIAGWGGAGIAISGSTEVSCSNLSVCQNSIGVVGATAINVTAAHYCNISGNTIAQINGAGASGIAVSGSSANPLNGLLAVNNSIAGAWQTGGNGMSYGISLNHCNNPNASNNVVTNAATAAFNIVACSGNVLLQGSSGFPRSGTGSPNGSVRGFWQGEMYLNTSGPDWWICNGGWNSTVWTRL